MRFFKVVFFLLCICFAQSQTLNPSKLDSLQKLLLIQSGKERILTLDELAWNLRKTNDSLPIQYAIEARDISKRISFFKGEADALNRLGTISKYRKEFDLAKGYYLEALKIAKENKYTHGIAREQYQLGMLYEKESNKIEALNAFLSSYEIARDQKEVEIHAMVASRIGRLYKSFGIYEKALKYELEALNIWNDLRDSIRIANTNEHLGRLYKVMRNYKQAMTYFKKARSTYVKKSLYKNILDVDISIGNIYDYKNKDSLAKLLFYRSLDFVKKHKLTNIGPIYHNLGKIHQKEKTKDSISFYYKKSIEVFKEKKDFSRLAISYSNLGRFYNEIGDFENALFFLESSLKLQKNSKDSLRIMKTYFGLSELYANKNQFKKSLKYRDSVDYFSDRIVASLKKADRYEVDYLKIKREKDQILHEKEVTEIDLKRKNILLVASFGTVFFLIVLFFVILRARKLQQAKILSEERLKQHKIIAVKDKKIQQQQIDELISTQEHKAINAMINGQEEERKRIAQDLHDRLGSMLSMVKIHYKSVENDLEKIKEETKEQYSKANDLLDDACSAVRKIAHNMISGTLMKFGLEPALKELKQKIEDIQKLEVELVVYGIDDRLDNKTEISIYRIVQELLNNTLKYAEANEVSVQLLKKENNLNIIVIDNGVGFEPEELNKKEGMGLKSVESRVIELQGELQIDSGRGNGTTITIDIPV